MISELLEHGQADFFVKGFKTSKLGSKYINLTKRHKCYILNHLMESLYVDLKKHESPDRVKKF